MSVSFADSLSQKKKKRLVVAKEHSYFLKEEFMQCFEVFCVLFHHCIFLAENGMHVP